MAKTRPGFGRVNGCEVHSGLDCGSSFANWVRSGPLCVYIRSNVPGTAWGSGSNGIGVRQEKRLATTTARRPRAYRGRGPPAGLHRDLPGPGRASGLGHGSIPEFRNCTMGK